MTKINLEKKFVQPNNLYTRFIYWNQQKSDKAMINLAKLKEFAEHRAALDKMIKK